MVDTLVTNGHVDISKTHPGLYRLVMLLAVGKIALGINFLVFTPTFFVYGFPNELWAVCFIVIGLSKIILLNLYQNLDLIRLAMGIAVAYTLIFAIGTMQPALEGKGSLQLPILYLTLVAVEMGLLLEPYINRTTAKGGV